MATATTTLPTDSLNTWIAIVSEISHGGEILIEKEAQIPPHIQTKYEASIIALANDFRKQDALGRLAYRALLQRQAPFLIKNFDRLFRHALEVATADVTRPLIRERLKEIKLVSKL